MCMCAATPQIESHLTLRSPSSPGLILQALEAVVRLNKGFRTDLCTRTRPQLGERAVASSRASLPRYWHCCLSTVVKALDMII